MRVSSLIHKRSHEIEIEGENKNSENCWRASDQRNAYTINQFPMVYEIQSIEKFAQQPLVLVLLSFSYVWLCFNPGFDASTIANFIQYSDIPKFEARRRMLLETAIKLNWAFGVRTSEYTLRLPYHFRATKPCCLGMDFFHFESSRDRSFERRLPQWAKCIKKSTRDRFQKLCTRCVISATIYSCIHETLCSVQELRIAVARVFT